MLNSISQKTILFTQHTLQIMIVFFHTYINYQNTIQFQIYPSLNNSKFGVKIVKI